jgi:membrane-associated phospholipid phosphatase
MRSSGCFRLMLLLFALGNSLWPQPSEQPSEDAIQFDDSPQSGQSSQEATDDSQPTSWKTVAPKTLKDQEKIYRDFPDNVIHGKHWIPVAVFLGVTGVLIGLDQWESPYFRRTATYHGFNSVVSGTNASLLIAGVPVTTYLTGLLTKNRYPQSTALSTAEAVADSEIAAEVLKLISRRARPESIPPRGSFADTWLDSHTITDGGFPSGHTIAAFSVATIMSRRYGHNRLWVPYLAYGLAGAIGFSRVTLSAHNVSDVFAGAALGYAISRFVVLGHHKR